MGKWDDNQGMFSKWVGWENGVVVKMGWLSNSVCENWFGCEKVYVKIVRFLKMCL
jgi:hypothetical protein